MILIVGSFVFDFGSRKIFENFRARKKNFGIFDFGSFEKFWIFYRIHGVRTKVNSILGRTSLCKYIHVKTIRIFFIFLRVRHVLRKLKSFEREIFKTLNF